MSLTVRRCLIALAVLCLIGAAINLPVSMQFLQSRIGSPKMPKVMLRGADAQAMGYPTPTPHATPWPPPTYWSTFEVFGYRRIDARAELPEIDDNLVMEFELTGWPLPVFERVHCWWPDPSRHPAWATTAEPDPVMRLHWKGVLLNPMLFALAAWIPLVVLPLTVRSAIRHRRMKHHRCPRCGYPMGQSSRCTECGAELPEPRNHIA